MKTVLLKEMHLVNFKAHKDLSIDFSPVTIISGDNKLGKSTVFDAFIWLLFGKDQFDRKDFEIIPIIDNVRLDRVDSIVEAIVFVGDEVLSLKRVLRQKWVRRRGTAEEVFDGCETLFYVNDVPFKAGEYKTKIDSIVDETVFKMITNPNCFLGLHWTKQREFLFQIAGTISDSEILDKMATLSNKDAIFNITNILNQGKSLVEFKKELSARKRKLKDDLDLIPSKIDQTRRLMPENRDFPAIELEVEHVDNEIKVVEGRIEDSSKAVRGQYEDIRKKQEQIGGLKSCQQVAISTAKTAAQKEAFEQNEKRRALDNDLMTSRRKVMDAKNTVSDTQRMFDGTKKQITDKEAEKEKLVQEWEDLNASEYKAQEGCLICPVFGSACNDTQAIGKHEEAQGTAKKSFFTAKETKLNDINERGIGMAKNIEGLKNRLDELKKDLDQAIADQKACEVEVERVSELITSTQYVTESTVIASELPAWQDLERQIKEINDTIQEVKPVDNSELQDKKAELVGRRDDLKKQLTEKDLITRYNKEVVSLQDQSKDLAQQIANLEQQEFQIAAFTKVKVEESERRINSMFEIVKFQMFDKTIDGNEFEVCIPTNKQGVPIAGTNTAEKVNAGMDIIRTLSNFYNVAAPIFADGSESVNQFIQVGSQMIFLRVTKEQVLTIQ